MTVRNGLKVVVNVVYVALAVHRAFQKTPAAVITASQRIRLKALVIAPFLSLLLFAFVALYPQASANISRGSVEPFTILAASMALLIYTISFLMFTAPEIPFACRSISTEESEQRLASETERLLAERVARLLDEKVYLDPDLSLETMAQRLKTHPNRLSRAINCVFDESFPSLIQRRRVRYFIEQADSGALDTRTILDLAFDAGFSSKSTFNRVFKDETGVSPSRYRATRSAT
jgi:AraC-like DNA-binding protein